MAGSLKELGHRIRDLRKARGWSQERFADVCGVHRTYMGHLERGEKNVSFSTLTRLANALGITLADLVSDEPRATGKAGTKQHRKANVDTESLGGIVRELTERRAALQDTADVLKRIADVLRNQERPPHKPRRR